MLLTWSFVPLLSRHHSISIGTVWNACSVEIKGFWPRAGISWFLGYQDVASEGGECWNLDMICSASIFELGDGVGACKYSPERFYVSMITITGSEPYLLFKSVLVVELESLPAPSHFGCTLLLL